MPMDARSGAPGSDGERGSEMPQILLGSARRSGVVIPRDRRWTDRISPNARFIAGELVLWAAVYGAYLGPARDRDRRRVPGVPATRTT